VESGLEDEAMNNWVKDHCVKHGPHAPGECPQCDELAEARSIVATTYIPPAPPSSNPSNEVAQLVKRLRARRDVTDHTVNDGVRNAPAPAAEVEAADMIERLQRALEGTHFHHKRFEPLCRTCCAALTG
jgi:hypothetical protein